MVANPEHRARIPYSHADIPKHVDDLGKIPENPQQAQKPGNGEKAVSMQQVIFDRRHIDLFNQALQDPTHEHRRAAERAMRGFARSVEKPQGISLNSAASEFNVPQTFLWRWAKIKGAIPILAEGNRRGSPTLIDKGKAQEVADLYHEAKALGIQPNTLLARKYVAQTFPKRENS